MSERLPGLGVVSEFLEVWITVSSSVIRTQSRPPESGGRRVSAYEVEVHGRVHGRERIGNKRLGVNGVADMNDYRRGWNPMFYLEGEYSVPTNHGIEDRFLQPVLKDVRRIKSLDIDLKSIDRSSLMDAFCCGLSEADLGKKENAGALAWVKKFEKEVNEKGQPLPEVLRQGKRPWYEMRLDKGADLVLSMNPDRRIYVAKLDGRRFVDQRLISFAKREPDADLDLIHALLNTSLSLFLIEASGFGRGLGVLDLTPTKLKTHLQILNPMLIPKECREVILSEFSNLKKREVLPIPEEMRSMDRHKFDSVVLASYGLEKWGEAIRRSLEQIYAIRKSVADA